MGGDIIDSEEWLRGIVIRVEEEPRGKRKASDWMDSIYFVDFDFTISRDDVWDAIVKESALKEWEEEVRRFLDGEISSRTFNQRLAAAVRTRESVAREVVLAIGIDPTFHDFVRWIEKNGSPMLIVSDGYDYYIRLLLEQEGLGHLTYYCNQLVWTETGIQVQFPLLNEACEQDMAHCKCQHILPHAGRRRVYIGDGVSDYCAARRCEVIYAKRNLLDYCRAESVECIPFTNFHDVMAEEEQRRQNGKTVSQVRMETRPR